MAAASYATNLVEIIGDTQTNATTNWTAIGTGGAGLNAGETDYYIEDAQCMSKNAWASAIKGMIYDTGSDQGGSGTDGAYSIWCTHLTPNSLNTISGGGVQFIIGSSTSAYNHYYIGGSDTIPFGGWILGAVKEQTATPDTTTGSPSGTVEQTFGCLWDLPSGGPTKGAPAAIDTVREGRHDIVITGGTTPDPDATFDGVISTLETPTLRWGLMAQRVPGGSFEQSGLIQFGTSGTAVNFTDSDKVIFLRDHPHVTYNFNTWETNNASSVTNLTNLVVKALGTTSPGRWVTNNNATVNMTTCQFIDMGPFGFDTNSTIDTCTFNNCDQVDANGGNMSGSSFAQFGWTGIIQSQDETSYDNSPTTEGTFSGGTGGYTVSDTITLSDGSVITVDAIGGSPFPVTQFTVTTAATTGRVGNGDTLTQVSTSGTGVGFTLTPDTDNLEDVASLLWNVASDPDGELDNCTFTMGTEASHAIEFGTTSPLTMTLTDVNFSGYNASNGATDSALWIRRTSGTVTINIAGGTTPSYKSDGATVSLVINPVTTLVNVKDENGDNLSGARVYLRASNGTGPLPFEDSVTMSRDAGTTVTVAHTAHGMATNDKVSIKGITNATEDNNGVRSITVTGVDSYTFTSSGSGTLTYTGTMTSTWVALEGLTDASGNASLSKSYTSNQPVEGWVRKGSASVRYKSFNISGTINNSTGLTIGVQMIPDE